jgi:hypothetical protein
MYFVAVLRRNRIQIGSEREAGQADLMLCGLRQLIAEHARITESEPENARHETST